MNNGPLLFLGLFAAMACSWLSFIMEPQLQIGSLQQTNTVAVGDASAETYPLAPPGDAHQGEEVYRADGCAACHTQMVRPQELGSDISHGWGARRSVAEDYLFDQPVMVGSQRVGPDLANFGRRSDVNGILMRLYDPRSLVPGSVMPAYRFLFETRKIEGAPSPGALVLPDRFAPAPGYEVVPRPEARALAAYLLSLRQDGYLFEAPPPPQPKTNSVPGAAVKK
ncbi:MAG TPA: cbb3-type cytochrome c oxidase subunit II [Candidatus Baltobacteraceae bacterium]|jgi:cytochrome c oxidase cbb3-type subunit 2|nr:cbb3-type cytochrome c oxidase subunit II [Candidatus Baltobacteraceae bacterium]